MRLLVLISSIASISIGIITVLGWLTGHMLMTSILPATIPMAPSTALFFMIIGSIQLIILSPFRARKTQWLVTFVSSIILIYSLIILAESLFRDNRHLEDFIWGNFGMFQNVPKGRMAPITAVLFILQSIALLCRRITHSSRRHWWNVSSSLGSVVLLVGFTLFLGYLHNTPILYDGFVIPMALPTAIAFVLQSISMICLCGLRSYPLRFFAGPSAYARILRAFLPIIIATSLLHDLTFMYLHTNFNINFAILSAFSALGFALILGFATFQVSRVIGNHIDHVAHEKKELAQLKSQFLNNMTHELRTPLNGILGFTDLLLQSQLTSSQLSQLKVIQTSSESLLGIVNNILSFTLLDRGVKAVLQSVSFSPREVIEHAIKNMIKFKKASVVLNIHFDETFPEKIIGDRERFEQLVTQLIHNAFKFTEHGKVSVRVHTQKSLTGEVHLRFEVSDTGRGISSEMRPLLFKPFFQEDGSLTRNSGGVGIGLALSQRLAEAFNGVIEFESHEGKGSSFWCTLVFATAETSNPILKQKFEGHPYILVVEDDESNQILIKRQLQNLGCRVDLADDGRQALQRVSENQYDLILMDVQMPVMDGFQATNAIRIQESHTKMHVPIIACTAHAHGEAQEQCLAAGMNGFITKPLSIPVLQQTLETWFQYKKAN